MTMRELLAGKTGTFGVTALAVWIAWEAGAPWWICAILGGLGLAWIGLNALQEPRQAK